MEQGIHREMALPSPMVVWPLWPQGIWGSIWTAKGNKNRLENYSFL